MEWRSPWRLATTPELVDTHLNPSERAARAGRRTMAAAEDPPLLRVAEFCQLHCCLNRLRAFQLQVDGDFRPMSEPNDQREEPIQKELDGEDESSNVRLREAAGQGFEP